MDRKITYYWLVCLTAFTLCSLNVSADLPNNSPCDVNDDCSSGYCNNNVCCNAGQCGHKSKCYDTGQSQYPGSPVCADGEWKTNKGWGCDVDQECVTGKCIDGFCCNPDQCGYNGSCYDLNDSYNVPGAFGGIDHVCTPEGWKLAYSELCENDSECATGKCLNSVCCNADECGARAGGSGCYGLGENFMTLVCVSEGTYRTRNNYSCENSSECASNICVNNKCAALDYPMNHTCNLGFECSSGHCADNVCCEAGQCGYYGRCWDLNKTFQTGMSNRKICTSQGWMNDYASSCSNDASCVTGRCINGACCNANQCAMAYMSPLFCKDVGEEVRVSASQIRACVSEGTWVTKTTNGYACANSIECASNICADGVCCDADQCGHYNRCYNLSQTYQTGMRNRRICTSEGWKLDYSQSCSENASCVTGRCINGACCNADECAYAYMSPIICSSPGSVVRYGPIQNWTCVSEGIWLKKTNNGYACNNDTECGSNHCAGGVCSDPPCQNLWWFDDEHNTSCGYKEFCGAYMYLGLRTFETETECTAALPVCVPEGETAVVYPGAADCCAGLTRISITYVENDVCATPSTGAVLCAYCGNGVCGPGENWCNCPQDCPEPCAGESEIPQWVITTPGGTGGYYKDCCQDLTKVLDWGYDENCVKTRTWANGVCVKECGDGLCTTGETKCNCPEDCPKESCNSLWWFDDLHNTSCGYKEFCGAYMYLGLRTFETETECTAALPVCVPEGETAVVYPGAADCCTGLTRISITYAENGVCSMPSVGAVMCAYCGNGVCGLGENWCNCPKDCFSESCKSLWWFDAEHNTNCDYKQFCGAYMYQGLMTFGTEGECLAALHPTTSTTTTSSSTTSTTLPCVGEGETVAVYPGAPECCSGLSEISIAYVEDGACAMPVGAVVCAYCGNGACGPGENWCNCPQDCLSGSCKDLWWFDDLHNTSCAYKEFCGAYAYQGLRTFETQEECTAALPTIPSTTTSTTTSSTTSSTLPQDCINGVIVEATGKGSLTYPHIMQLWIDGELKAEWNAVNLFRKYEYEEEFSCGAHEIDVVNACPNDEWKTLHVYSMQAECTKTDPESPTVIYDRSINSTPFDLIEAIEGRTDMEWPGALRFTYTKECGDGCALAGDYPPCGTITLSEIIGLINKWSQGEAGIDDVVALVLEWA